MAKKHQSRPSAAARKKVEEQKQAMRRQELKKYQKPILIGAGALVALILVIVLAVDFFDAPNGSVRMFLGNLMGVNETSIIRQMDDDLYYELGSMKQPEGYAAEPYEIFSNSDKNERNRYFITDDASKAINNIYAAGVPNRTSAEMIELVQSQGNNYALLSEPREAEIAGHQVKYLYGQGNPSETDGLQTALLVMYVDTVHDSCILVNCSSAKGEAEQLPTEEAMMAEVEAIFSCLSIPTK